MNIISLDWEDVLPIWKKYLWPNKKNGIKKTNNWIWEIGKKVLETDNLILNNNVFFFGISDNKKIIAVNSIFSSQPNYTRSRGLWVHNDYRKNGLAKILLNHCIENTTTSYIWTVPRKTALPAYESVGFIKISEWFDQGQYGPNCIAYKKIK